MSLRKNPSPTTKKKISDIPDDLGVVKARDLIKFRSYVFYGRPGTGKTTLFGTFPGPKLLLNIRDNGTDSVMDIEDLDIKNIETWEDLEETFWWLKKHPKKYQSVCLDTTTHLQDIGVEDVMAKNKKKLKDAGKWGSMRKQDWGEVSGLMKMWITNFRDLPMNVVFIAQERAFNVDDEEDESEMSPEIGPRLMPSVRSHINSVVNVIGSTFIRVKRVKKEVKGKKIVREVPTYCLRIGPNPLYDTKVRKPRDIELPHYLEDPNYDDIIELIKGD